MINEYYQAALADLVNTRSDTVRLVFKRYTASRSSAVSTSEIDVTARSRSRPALCSPASSARVDGQDPHQYGQTQSRISGASSPWARV
jgi:hypothetical protein